MSATLRDTVYTSSAAKKPLIPKTNPTNEKPAGEWNSYDITCKGSTIEVSVNGLLQNTATNCSVTKGGIGLQAEGSKIQFRNLWIEPLK
jgi:predicted small secreted protein